MPLLEPEGGARPDVETPRPLETPSEPKLSYLRYQLEALIEYLAEGGGVAMHRKSRPGSDDRLQITFVVYRSPHQAIAKRIRDEATGEQPWVWQPKRGLHRKRAP